MFLRRLTLFNFKNYDEAEFSFSEGANAFTGQNGSGKTNILDAIHYLCLCKSYFNSGDALSIKHLQSFFSINGTFELDGKNEEILVLVKNGQKRALKGIKRSIPDWENILDYYLWLWRHQLTRNSSVGEVKREEN